jgi:beta-galactosidase/beta-glucuronidase
MSQNLRSPKTIQRLLVGLIVLALLALPGCSSSPAATALPPSVSRQTIDFNLDWKYFQGDVNGADAKVFDDAKWIYVDLPHSTKFVTPEDPNAYLGVSWYRKHFSVASSAQGKKVYIEFEAAMQSVDVWVNGAKLLRHVGGYTPFTIDVTNAISYGTANNVIAVRVDSNANPDWAPGWNGVDFQYDGGLYRDVHMIVTDKLHITDAVYANTPAGGGVFVTYPSVSAGSAMVEIKTNILNENAAAQNATLISTILDAQGKAVGTAATTASVAAGQGHDFLQDITITNPHLWDPNHPNLYTLNSTVKDGVTVVDDLSTHIGIRRIAWTHDGGLSINGVQYQLPGVNLHQEIYGLGDALPDQAIYYDVKRIKEAGLDFIRGSHYPHSPAFYDACDELGIVVLDAQTGWQQYNDTPAFNANTFQELRDMLRRDRNHPSVVAWEASLNESNYTAAWAMTANQIVHQE